MKIPRLALLLASAAPVFAGLNSAAIVLPSGTGRPAPSVSIVQPADYLCAIVTLRATVKDPERQSTAMREAIQRLTDMQIERSILATSINCIIGQRLARRACTACCASGKPDTELLHLLGVDKAPTGGTFVTAVGCTECGGTGYRGRIPLFEVMTMTDEIALLVNAPTREIEAMAVSQGMATLREDGVRLAAAGITTLEEVRRVAGETVGPTS